MMFGSRGSEASSDGWAKMMELHSRHAKMPILRMEMEFFIFEPVRCSRVFGTYFGPRMKQGICLVEGLLLNGNSDRVGARGELRNGFSGIWPLVGVIFGILEREETLRKEVHGCYF